MNKSSNFLNKIISLIFMMTGCSGIYSLHLYAALKGPD